jgi:hypothetical protein
MDIIMMMMKCVGGSEMCYGVPGARGLALGVPIGSGTAMKEV